MIRKYRGPRWRNYMRSPRLRTLVQEVSHPHQQVEPLVNNVAELLV